MRATQSTNATTKQCRDRPTDATDTVVPSAPTAPTAAVTAIHRISDPAPEGAQGVALSPTAPVVHDEDAAPAVEEPGATLVPDLMQQTAIALEQLRQLLDTSNLIVPYFL